MLPYLPPEARSPSEAATTRHSPATAPVARQAWIPQPGVLCWPEPGVRARVSLGGRERKAGVGARRLGSLSQLGHSLREARRTPPLPKPSTSPSVHWAHLRCFPRALVIPATSLQGSAEAGPRVTVGSPDPAHSPSGLGVLKAPAGVKGRGLGDGHSCSQILALPFT